MVNAQEVRVIDNKGTIRTVRNNKVTTSNTAPVLPVEGDIWFDTSGTTTITNTYDDVQGWIAISSSSSTSTGWLLTGNTGTATSFLGTTNFNSLFLRVNSTNIGTFHPLGAIGLGRNANANNNQGIAIGESAASGNQAIALGYEANANAFRALAIGLESVASNNEASAFGFKSQATGFQSSAIGHSANASGQNSTAIGHGASTNQANAIVLGNTLDDSNFSGTKIGMGTTTPTARLHVDGNFRLVDGTEGLNKVLTSDANGNASWQTISQITIAEVYDTTGGQVINEGTFSDINFATTGIVDTDDYTITSPNTITITTVGRYEIKYRVSTQTTNNARNGGEFYLEINGTEAPGTRAYTYTRNNLVDRNTVTVFKVIETTTTNTTIKVKGQVYASSQNGTTSQLTMVANGSSIQIKKIK